MSLGAGAIGVFDSGVGGLTVVQAIRRLLPSEDILYVGDTARVPYGNKSPETITAYSRQITQYLSDQQVKAVVVACNTATAYSLEELQSRFDLPVLGVIEPGVDAALSATQSGRIGIIGTTGTIGSGAYQKALLKRRADLKIFPFATPLLVPLIEEDWLNHAATHLVLAEYLQPMLEARVDTLVLGCTHYPLLKGMIQTIVAGQMELVDSADNMALKLQLVLESHGLLRPLGQDSGEVRIFATDLSPRFRPLAERFLKSSVNSIERLDWGS